MKHVLLILSLFVVTGSLFAQGESEVPAERPISMDEVRNAKTIADLANRNLNWEEAQGGEFTYVEAHKTQLHVITFKGTTFPDSILKLLARAEPGTRLYIDNIRLPQDDGTTVVTNISRVVK